MKAKHGRTSLLSVEGEKSTDKDMNHQINNTKGCTMVKSNNTVNFIFLEVYFERFEIGMCVYGRSSVGRHDSTCRQKNRRCSAKRSKTCTNTAKTETKAGGKKQKKKIYGQRPDFKGVIWILICWKGHWMELATCEPTSTRQRNMVCTSLSSPGWRRT